MSEQTTGTTAPRAEEMRVGVIGVGVMGSAIARRLIACGADVALFDLSDAAMAPLVALGARACASPAQAAAGMDAVITSLNSAAIVEAAVFGPDGVAQASPLPGLLIDMSSIAPDRTTALAARLRADTGVAWVDAPLSGGAPAALKGELTLMIGGEADDVAQAQPVLELLSARASHMGAVGAGQTVKLVNQILCALNFLAVAEAVRFAEGHGIDASQIPAALAGGRADSRIMQEFMAKMAARDFSSTGRIDNMLKDLETAQSAALAGRIPLPLTSMAADLHRMLVAGGYGPADSAEYMRLFDLGHT
ncbi:NAD-binding protein [Novosphingobium sp. FSY-8]|uniref:NAD-binding protein n=1 Tax=Novosphingobium ovatum TaxID=1908523 RepID=A0ABW9XDV6_9SPHN|nr:NAD(P)-dependent oxidoreductase [Novosphingobium ovatum]NBC36632.1 NAD-binding protein [Novosphingobium ovatum]